MEVSPPLKCHWQAAAPLVSGGEGKRGRHELNERETFARHAIFVHVRAGLPRFGNYS